MYSNMLIDDIDSSKELSIYGSQDILAFFPINMIH